MAALFTNFSFAKLEIFINGSACFFKFWKKHLNLSKTKADILKYKNWANFHSFLIGPTVGRNLDWVRWQAEVAGDRASAIREERRVQIGEQVQNIQH